MPCERKIGPFDCCSVVQGDCLELMREVPAFVALVTDPPYGIDLQFKYGNRGGAYPMGPRAFPPVYGDNSDFDPVPFLSFSYVLLWGAEHYAGRLPRDGQWLIWDKRCGVVPPRNQGDCEIAWLNQHGQTRIFRHLWDGMVKASEHGESRTHPTQKPIELMTWCISFIPSEFPILDPASIYLTQEGESRDDGGVPCC